MSMSEPQLPFAFVGSFECEHCHALIEKKQQFPGPDDYQDYKFDVRCDCGWNRTAIPGRRAKVVAIAFWQEAGIPNF